jgi:AcrR family transcriptional regulator
MGKDARRYGEPEVNTLKRTAAAKVFETARELFYKRGIRAVGVDEIVHEAGVTKPSLYRAFKSKDDLVSACLQESAKDSREALTLALAGAGDDPRRRLDAALRHFADKLSHPDFRGCPMSNVAVEFAEPGSPAREIVEDCKSGLRHTIVQLCRDIGVTDPETLADGLLLVIEGAIATHHIFGSQGPAHSMLSTCNALIGAHLAQRNVSAARKRG